MPQGTPNSEGETRKSRLELLKQRVGKEVEATETSIPQVEDSTSTPVMPSPPVSAPKAAQETQQLPAMPYPKYSLGQPSFHDRRSKVPYALRYHKENVMYDLRLLGPIYDWMAKNGINKTDAVNRAWLKVLLADGYPIDPNILDRPFLPEDLPEGL